MKNNKTSILDIKNKIFNINILGERNADIFLSYSLKSFKKETMQSLGDKYDISKEAVRISLKNSFEVAEIESNQLTKEIDTIASYLENIKISTLTELRTLLNNNGVACSDEKEAAIAIFVAQNFSSKETSLSIIKFGNCEDNCHVFVSSDEVEKELLKLQSKSIKFIKKNGGCDLNIILEQAGFDSIDKSVSSKLLKSILCPCEKNDIRLAEDDFYFHINRNKILSRVHKAAVTHSSACPSKLVNAVNQSIKHRCKEAVELSSVQLISMIEQSSMGSLIEGKIVFSESCDDIEFYNGEINVVEALVDNPGMELSDIEVVLETKELSKASVFQLCSISPLISKSGRKYYAVA